MEISCFYPAAASIAVLFAQYELWSFLVGCAAYTVHRTINPLQPTAVDFLQQCY